MEEQILEKLSILDTKSFVCTFLSVHTAYSLITLTILSPWTQDVK